MQNVLAKAQALMTDQGYWEKLDEAASVNSGRKIKSRESNMNVNNENIQRIQYDPQLDRRQTPPKFDNAIMESFKNTPPLSGDNVMMGGYAGQIPESFLSGLGNFGMPQKDPSQEKQMPNMEYRSKKQQIQEAAYQNYQQRPMQQQAPMNTGASIDYNYLKWIIMECLKEHSSNNVMNESVGSVAGLKMMPGNKIQFMDSKGNIYEGVLTLKKKGQVK